MTLLLIYLTYRPASVSTVSQVYGPAIKYIPSSHAYPSMKILWTIECRFSISVSSDVRLSMHILQYFLQIHHPSHGQAACGCNVEVVIYQLSEFSMANQFFFQTRARNITSLSMKNVVWLRIHSLEKSPFALNWLLRKQIVSQTQKYPLSTCKL